MVSVAAKFFLANFVHGSAFGLSRVVFHALTVHQVALVVVH